MSALKLEELTLRNFRSFRKETTIKFPERGMVLLRGVSGAGKSSIFLAIAYALGYCPFDGTSLKSWDSEDKHPRVKLTLRVGDSSVVVSRGARLEVAIDGNAFEGSAANKEQELRRLLGVDPKMLQALTYRPQRKPSLFLSMTDAKKKEFLCDLLGLTQFEEAADSAVKEANKREVECGVLIQTAAAMATSIPAEPEPYVPGDVSIHESRQRQLEQKLASDTAEYRALELQIKQMKLQDQILVQEIDIQLDEELKKVEPLLRAIERPAKEQADVSKLQERLKIVNDKIAELSEAHAQSGKRLNARVVELNAAWEKSFSEYNRIGEHKRALMKADADLEKALALACPTCRQAWSPEANQLEELKSVRNRLIERVQMCFEAQERCRQLNEQRQQATKDLNVWQCTGPDGDVPPEMRSIQDQLKVRISAADSQADSDYKARMADFDARSSELTWKISSIKDSYRAKRNELLFQRKDLVSSAERSAVSLEKEIADSLREFARTTDYIKELILLNESNRRLLGEAVSNRERAKLKAQAAQEAAEKAQRDVAALRDFSRLVGREGFLGAIFDEVLSEISAESNERIVSIPNVSHVTLQFVSSHETAAGQERKEIRPIIEANGTEVPLEALSGGQSTAIELAVDQAVASVIARRSSIQPGWLVLDEAFDGMNGTVKEACMESLQAVARERFVLVVDHDAETKELFESFIDIQHHDGESKVL